MPCHNFAAPQGRVVELVLESSRLHDNMLGDPGKRIVSVYLPRDYERKDSFYPLVVDLAAFGGSGLKRLAWQGFGESVPQRIDRLIAQGHMGPVVAVFPDCFTSLGGNQYVDSTALGAWESFLVHDLVPRIETEFRVARGRRHRAVLGKSSGGYGALIQGMRHAEVWGAVACHSGDMGFEWLYLRDFPLALDVLARFGSDVGSFLDHVQTTKKLSSKEFTTLMVLAMSASYDPDPHAVAGIRLPVDLRTCVLDSLAWERWLAHDPLRLVENPQCLDSLRRLSGLFFDCGSRDQYGLHYGARRLHDRLTALDVPHQFEEFDDDHSGVDYRLDVSLPFLFRRIAT